MEARPEGLGSSTYDASSHEYASWLSIEVAGTARRPKVRCQLDHRCCLRAEGVPYQD